MRKTITALAVLTALAAGALGASTTHTDAGAPVGDHARVGSNARVINPGARV